jgi:hypothetical protein
MGGAAGSSSSIGCEPMTALAIKIQNIQDRMSCVINKQANKASNTTELQNMAKIKIGKSTGCSIGIQQTIKGSVRAITQLDNSTKQSITAVIHNTSYLLYNKGELHI